MTLHPQMIPGTASMFSVNSIIYGLRVSSSSSSYNRMSFGSPSFSDIFGGLLEYLRVPRLSGGSA